MKICIATNDLETVNEHFGRTKMFVIYEVTSSGYKFVESVSLKSQGDEQDDKIEERINALKSCAIVYCTQIGGVAAARLVKNKIHPIKVSSGQPIDEILKKLQDRLENNPPLWLRRRVNAGVPE